MFLMVFIQLCIRMQQQLLIVVVAHSLCSRFCGLGI